MEASPTKVYERWSENFWPDLFALWKLWVPATAMNFAFSPMWMRIPVVASTSLILDVYPVVHARRVRRDRGGSERRSLAREGRGAGRRSHVGIWRCRRASGGVVCNRAWLGACRMSMITSRSRRSFAR